MDGYSLMEIIGRFKGLVYRSPLSIVIVAVFVTVVCWGWVGYICIEKKRKNELWKTINVVLLIIGVLMILEATVLNRTCGKREVILIPLYSFYEAIEQSEFYRSMLMNVFLFVPLGLTVPFLLLNKVHKKVMFSVVLGFGLSVGIEVIQFAFCLGRAEVDDVICNTLGVLIGSMSFLLYSRLERSKSR